MSLRDHSQLGESTDHNFDRSRYVQRNNGRAGDHRLGDPETSVADQPFDRLSDAARRGCPRPIRIAAPGDGVWGPCHGDHRPNLGDDFSGLARSWGRVLLPATWDGAWRGLHTVDNCGDHPLRLGHSGVSRWGDSLHRFAVPALFQTVDDSVRTVSRHRHDRHAGRSGNPMKRGTTYGYSLRGLKAGDGNAWSWLVAEFSGKLVGYATRMGARDPEEVMSATLETIARRIADFEGNESQMRSFIFSIAHARIVDDLRRTTRRSEVSIENTLNLLEADEPNEDTFTDPELLKALGRLPEDQRKMLELRYVMGLSTKETADAIGKSEVATRVGLSRAFSRLKDLLIDDLRVGADEEVSS